MPRRRRAIQIARALGVGVIACIGAMAGALPAGAASPTASATPSSGLRDGQILTIHGAGFTPNHQVQILECAGTAAAPPKDQRSCEGDTLDASSFATPQGTMVDEPHDPKGYTAGFPVYALPDKTLTVVSISCGPANPCVLYVGEDFHDFTQPHTFIPLRFGGALGSGPSPSSHNGGSSTGIVVGLVAAVAALAALGGIVARRRRARHDGGRNQDDELVTAEQ